jgi:2-polyprenyl-6-methoxyphenol hydroxylase-like FAD-dependent oxidoreductase
VAHSDPPRCSAHSSPKWGAPPGNQNALKHGFYVHRAHEERLQDIPPSEWSIDTIILDVCIKQARLSRFIERHRAELSTKELARFLHIHGQNASRLGRLLRDRRALCGDAADGIPAAIAQALDELHEEMGTVIP